MPDDPAIPEPVPAATVVLLRERDSTTEVLMLRKNADIDFGGMWVFPGGCIEDTDFTAGGDICAAARAAAARETAEETGIEADPAEFQWFARWTPPALRRKRFKTWFFAAAIDGADAVTIDGDEIHGYQWISPTRALEHHHEGRIRLVAPTWVTLYYLSRYPSLDALMTRLAASPAKDYQSRPVKDEAGHHAVLWRGDAGYDTWDASVPGERHRLVIQGDRYLFENTIEPY